MADNSTPEAIGHTPIWGSGGQRAGDDEIRRRQDWRLDQARKACNMICAAEKRGLLHPDTVIVEPTGGNQSIGLALIGAVRGCRVRLILPDSVSRERRFATDRGTFWQEGTSIGQLKTRRTSL